MEIKYNGEKVLLVDGDPQCNLSSLILGDSFYDYYESDDTKFNNIKDAVKVAFDGRPSPIKAIECYSPKDNDNLYLIPCHMDLSSYDSSLSLAINSSNAISTLQNLPGAFYELVRLCCEKYSIDYVFIDMNPGLSSINQSLFMMCDGFIVPTNPDPFSVMALNTLTKVLPRWKKWAERSRSLYEDSAYPLPPAKMKFIGEIVQRFTLRKGKAARPYEARISEIKDTIEKTVVPIFESNNMLFDIGPLKKKGVLEDRCLGEISEFGSLLQKANNASIPIFELNESNIKETGKVLTQMLESKERFSDIFSRICNIILEIL